MDARPYYSAGGIARPVTASALVGPMVLVGYGLGVILLFAMGLSFVLDTTFRDPPAQVLQTTFAARTDVEVVYAVQPAMTIARQRPLVAVAAVPTVND